MSVAASATTATEPDAASAARALGTPPATLDAIEAEVWALLEAGTRSHRAPFHDGVIGSIGLDGPNLRTVILRGVETQARRVLCHTDTRSPKFTELRSDPRVAWTFYDHPSRLQLRLWGRATLHAGDALADARWQATSLASRRIYHAIAAPGSISAQGTSGWPEAMTDDAWTLAASEQARPNFAVVATAVTRLEALYLHHAGHRRASFRYAEGGARLAADWLIP